MFIGTLWHIEHESTAILSSSSEATVQSNTISRSSLNECLQILAKWDLKKKQPDFLYEQSLCTSWKDASYEIWKYAYGKSFLTVCVNVLEVAFAYHVQLGLPREGIPNSAM